MSTPDQTTAATEPLNLPADVPIALLPVRMETRYLDGKLLVRIYPDILHIDAHEPGLTDDEIEHGVRYWAQVAEAAGDSDRLAGAWSALAGAHGAARAAWIARRTRDGRPAPDPQPVRAALARLLPTRWRLAGYRFSSLFGGGTYLEFDIAGKPIRRDLAVSPSHAGSAGPDTTDDEAVVDPDMAWLLDYAAAEEAGMAITVTRADDPNLGVPLTRLVVYGVNEGADAGSGPTQLAELLSAHHYTDGLGFVAPGTPTNNTDGRRSGYTPDSPEASERHRAVDGTRTAPPVVAAGSDTDRLATALGLDAAGRSVLAQVLGGERFDHQAAMNAAVWASSWGYFLFHILDGVSLPAIRAARRHFIDHVRAGGSLPVLRVGEQPYGVLPVLSLAHWRQRGGGAADAAIVRLLRLALPGWVDASWRATVGPRWPFPAANPGERYVQLLATAPAAVEYVGRSALGPEYVSSLWRFLQLDFDAGWRDAPHTAANRALADWGLPTDQRHTGTVYAEEAFPVTGPATGADAGTYLPQLLDLDPRALAAAAEHGDTPLLYRLVRHSALQELWTAAATLLGGDRSLVDEELVDGDTALPPTRTLWRVLDEPAPGGDGRTVGADLAARPATDEIVADLHEFRDRVRSLGQVEPQELDRLLRGSLDLAAHRLDAWLSSFADQRLSYLRDPARTPGGLLIGGFGWLTNVGPTKLTESDHMPAGETAPLYVDEANAGHVIAPSLQHATTAAVLHAGYVARGGKAGKAGAVAVDLSAERVRLARFLTEGVRAGQSLGALLGYRFERALAEGGVDGVPALILPFRLLAPFTAQTLAADGSAAEVTGPGSVADGAVLVDRWRAGTVPWGTAPDPVGHPEAVLPAVGTDEHEACVAALARTAEGVDALADIALAEGVHHLVAGNVARAGAALDALGKGEAPAPDLDVIRTPRSGVVHTHRLMFLGSLDWADAGTWPTDGRQLRAGIEPMLNGWAARMLGDPARVRCRGAWHGADGTVLAEAEITFDRLRLSALDLIALAGDERGDGGFELRQRLIGALRLERPAHVPELIAAVPSFDRHPSWPADVLSVGELLQLAGAVRRTLAGARKLVPDDLCGPGQTMNAQWDVADITNRVAAAEHALRQNRDALATAADAGDIGGMGGYLVNLSYAGIPGTFPEAIRGWDEQWREELRSRSRAAVAEVDRRLAAKSDVERGFDDAAAADPQRVEHHVARLRAMLGEDFPVAPMFRVTDPAAVTDVLSHSPELLAGDPLAPATWLDRLARVRPAARRLHAALACAEATGATQTDLRVAQLPYVAGESWLALPSGPRAARTALAVHSVRPVDPTRSLAGLVFDEWTEMVPGETEVTGLTFHYDAPSARAPQAVLLAVPPGADGAWTAEILRDTVTEAMDLARARAVDLQTLNEHGHFLPALYFALNETGATVATDFTGDATPAGTREGARA